MIREDEITEFKKTTNELDSAMISISSMLNKHGRGTIYFGVKNDGSAFSFTITDSTLRDVSRKIYESIKPQIFPVIKTEIINDIEVISVSFEGKDIPYSAFGKYYIRIADEDRELTPSELRKIMIKKEYEDNWENISSKETIYDVDLNTINQFYKSAIECGRLPEIGNDKEVLLTKLGLLNGTYLTNAGKLLFSANKPLTLKMAIFATDHKTTFLDIVKQEGNIFQLIDAAMSYIIRNIRWSVKMSEDNIHRIEIPEVPIDALREAVINSFAHARYDSFIQHEIDIFSNRISIVNPGSFANSFEPVDFVNRDLHSFLRNEVIANTLYLCKDVETFGSGLRKIYTLCDESKVDIGYINEDSYFTFEFYREDINVIRRQFMEYSEIKDIMSDLESKILSIMKETPNITTTALANKTNKSLRTINRCISSLKNKDLIKRVGSNKKGYWSTKK